jgi:hypothetical protein
MELTYVTIIVLASMIFILAGMIGYLYWQQTRMLQHMQSLSTFMASQFTQPPEEQQHDVEAPQLPEEEPKPKPDSDSESEEDDRLSVEEKVEVVEGPPSKEEVDVDDLQSKTATQLKELLTKKGIPFGKRDSKPMLLQLLKAIA